MTDTSLNAICPVCDATVPLKNDTVVSEVISCMDCGSKLVLQSIDGSKVMLKEAPAVEEDWGE